MRREYWIAPCSGRSIDIAAGQTITVIDVEGGQAADFFAKRAGAPEEFLSPAVTLDCNESLRLQAGDMLYSNLYRPMFTLVRDDVGRHDLLFPCCRPEMYDFFYGNGTDHPNCYDNINRSLGERRAIIQPVNLFMNTSVDADGKITISPPLSKAGDSVALRALMDMRIGVAACSVSEGECNARRCTAIRAIVDDG